MGYYDAIVVITLFIQVMLIAAVNGNYMLSKAKQRRFIDCFGLLAVVTLCEWAGVRLNGAGAEFYLLHIYVKLIEVCLAPFVAVSAVQAIRISKHWRIIMYVALAHLVVELIAVPFGWIIQVTDDNIYVHGPYYYIYTISYICCLILFFREVMQVNRRYQNKNLLLVILMVVFLILGSSMHTSESSIRTEWLCVSVTMIVFYLYYTELILNVDALTGLLNRSCYMNNLENMRSPSRILFFDVNKFKNVNDSYGHSFGDVCLAGVALAIKQTYFRYGRCYRIGGDEFCVVLTRNTSQMEAMNKEFEARIQARRDADPRFPTASIGYTDYDPKKDHASDAINRADAMMYKNKEKAHMAEAKAITGQR